MSKVTSLSHFKADASQLIASIRKSGETVVLTQNGEATAIVQDIETYQKTQRALVMLKLLAQGEADIRNGETADQAAVFNRLEKKLRAHD
jgi:PHD/YefM family antitoxin component YafN of YafNO toxin-antitoxin module